MLIYNMYVILLSKLSGTTLAQCIQVIRQTQSIPSSIKLAYAGRLDPLASGLLLILQGDECKDRSLYQSLDKEYIVDIVFGLSTDTHDLMGILQMPFNATFPTITEIQKYLTSIRGKPWNMSYPIYSSKSVDGKPLYWWARQNKIHEISIPTKTVMLHTVELLAYTPVSLLSLLVGACMQIRSVKGDFRQHVITDQWNTILQKKSDVEVIVLTVKVSCSTGTYMRTFAHHIGTMFGCGACASRIVRTRIGKYTLRSVLQ